MLCCTQDYYPLWQWWRLSERGDIASRNQINGGEPNDLDVRILDEEFLSSNDRGYDLFRDD